MKSILILMLTMPSPTRAEQPLCMDPQFQSAVGTTADCFDSNSPLSCDITFGALGFTVGAAVMGLKADIRGGQARRVGLKFFEPQTKVSILESIDERKAFVERLRRAGYGGAALKEIEADLARMSETHAQKKANFERKKMELERRKLPPGEHRIELEKIRPSVDPMENRLQLRLILGAKAGVGRATLRGGVLGLVVGDLTPLAINWTTRKICADSIPFSSPEDLEIFKRYADIYQPCLTYINKEKFEDLMSLSWSERHSLFKKSPALCNAFEQQGINQLTAVIHSQVQPIVKRISCGENEISVPYMADKTESQIKFVKHGSNIGFVGSFSANDFSDEDDKTKFSVTLKDDLTWSSVSTRNRIWGTAPGATEFISDATNLRKFLRDNPTCLKSLQRQEVELAQSTTGLYCAVARQLIVADQLLPAALENCPQFGGDKILQRTKSGDQISIK